MPLTVTQKFHVHNAKQFIESVTESENDNYYLFVGRPVPWTNGDDDDPDTPTASVKNSSYDYLRDILVMRKIRGEDLIQVARRYDWTTNTRYTMYDHRVSQVDFLANTTAPGYVLTSNYDVFKCIYDGRTTSNSLADLSVDEPTVVGQSDIGAITSAGTYRWKFLYNIPTADRSRYLNSQFMPVRSVGSVLDYVDDPASNGYIGSGDVYNDGTSKYQVFDNARLFGNGAIYQIVLDTVGNSYASAPTVTIAGDGSGATAQAFIAANTVSRIQIISPGTNYSWATVTIEPPSPSAANSAATATAIINPRYAFTNTSGTYYVSSHAIHLEEELGASGVMLYAELAGSMGGIMTVGNQYRRVGILRNPVEYGTNTRATGNVYSQMTILTIPADSGAVFQPDELVWQAATNASGVVVDMIGNTVRLVGVGFNGEQFVVGQTISGIGNGRVEGQEISPNPEQNIPAFPGPYVPPTEKSGVVGVMVEAIDYPDLEPLSGDVLFVDHRAPVTRAPNQQEVVRTILEF